MCSAAPEFIWRGAGAAIAHAGIHELEATLFTGLVLAFFVEPLFERLRGLAHGAPAHEERSAAFAALVGFGFALAAICVHEAMKGFFTLAGPDAYPAGAEGAVALTVGWALTPFLIKLAWFTRRIPAVGVPAAILAAAAPTICGALFNWTQADILSTTLPCVTILLLGYRRPGWADGGDPRGDQARLVAAVAAAWLVAAALMDLALDASHLRRWAPYNPTGFWTDVRFYAGWAAGLLLAPNPVRRTRAVPT